MAHMVRRGAPHAAAYAVWRFVFKISTISRLLCVAVT